MTEITEEDDLSSLTEEDYLGREIVCPITALSVPFKKGLLSKWTNYIHGWQSRYFELHDGVLVYYKSEYDTSFGCRGSVTVGRAVVEMNENDNFRFDIAANNSVWYLRAENCEERQKWIHALEIYKTDSGFGSQTDLLRHGSMASLVSTKSTASTSSKTSVSLREKLAELETFRDIVNRQVDTLQIYFDSLALADNHTVPNRNGNGPPGTTTHSVEDIFASLGSESKVLTDNTTGGYLKGEALTFKATTGAILITLEQCIELVQQRDDAWRKRLFKEMEKRKRLDDQCKQMQRMNVQQQKRRPAVVFGGPDFQEGPNSAIKEDEWHDAVDAALYQIDMEDERLCRIMGREASTAQIYAPISESVLLSPSHALFQEIEKLTTEQLCYAKAGVGEGVWQLFADEGEMKMYKRDLEIDGMVCDPLKAVHTVKGVTAREYLHYFYEPSYKLDWDTTLDSMRVVDTLSEDSCIIHQVHKRVWPAAQRESLFWSHFRNMSAHKDPEASDLFIVCNHDVELPDVPLSNKNCLRVGLTIAMVCQTVIRKVTQSKGQNKDAPCRDELTCKIIYVAQVNPGGWAPNSVLRAVYKREYPKFLKRFTQYVQQKVRQKPILL